MQSGKSGMDFWLTVLNKLEWVYSSLLHVFFFFIFVIWGKFLPYRCDMRIKNTGFKMQSACHYMCSESITAMRRVRVGQWVSVMGNTGKKWIKLCSLEIVVRPMNLQKCRESKVDRWLIKWLIGFLWILRVRINIL